ncbi:MAG: helix-turn-helix domain-containing protein [Pseudomonadota bacterium]
MTCAPPSSDADITALREAVTALRAQPATLADMRAFAALARVSQARLDQLCREHYHLSARTLVDRARVESARASLAAGVSTSAAGSDAGFSSERNYTQQFLHAHGLTPSAYRELANGRIQRRPMRALILRLPAGFATVPIRHLMGRDPSAASERVLQADGHALSLERGFQSADTREAGVLHLSVSGREAHLCITSRSGTPCSPALCLTAHAITRRLLGFESHLPTLRARARDPQCAWFAPLLAHQPGLRVPLMGSEYEALIWAILGQQVNLTFAAQLRAELIRLAQPGLASSDNKLLPHPTPAQVAQLDPKTLQGRRFSRSKARWVVDLSGAIVQGQLRLRALGSAPACEAYDGLLAQKGIGDWTAQYVMLRGMGLNDCVPAADAGLMRNLHGILGTQERPTAHDVARCLAPLAPARSVACQHLWTWQA